MSLFVDIKNALALLMRGEWREFYLRLRIYCGEIDLQNVSTEALGFQDECGHEYSDSGGKRLEKVLNSIGITPQDSIVDFGSGKGGALITFSRYPFKKITGVEIVPELADIAEKNLHKLNIRNIRMVVIDAADFTDLDEYNYFYFFSPFPGSVMRRVIINIGNSLLKLPRKAVIIYFNPEYHNEVITDSPFTKIDEFNHHDLKYFIYSNVHEFQ
jgi:16S rRNA G966 N2-methylase RsmD